MGKYIKKHLEFCVNENDDEKKILKNGVKNIFFIEQSSNIYAEISMNIDEFSRYCAAHNIEEVFLDSNQVMIDDYLITDEIIESNKEGGEETFRFIKSFANEWNDEINYMKSNGIETSGIRTYFLFYGSLTIKAEVGQNYIKDYIREVFDMDDNKEISEELSGEEILSMFIEKNLDAYLETIDSESEEDSLYEELQEMVLSDKRFISCTNKSMREIYACELWKKASIKLKYEKLFGTPYRLAVELDRIYGDYKRSLVKE